ncbi:ABC-three component system middle component 6 [Gimesia panareensis]|uniref:ABC-three component system middle component 6 n=1 Tax=Gimesia panareensis TaxID=2527978 RepID=UPI00118BFE71|nr:ABC-three component system middle component 6 [Gimesia panareensis]QDU48440.1 hypothetical protein Pan110_07540 [Gimesia panareensis]
MILPSKHISIERSLIGVGLEILNELDRPKSVSRLWDDIQKRRADTMNQLPYDWFLLSLNMLYTIDALTLIDGRFRRGQLFGENSTEANIENLEFPEIIARLQHTNLSPISRFSFPDPAKLAHNRLSDESADWLRLGERKESLVEACIKTNQDPTVGEKIAEAFRVKYQELRSSNLESDMIFQILWEFAGEEELTSRQQQATMAAIMAYFFHKCDIFENVPE